KGIATGVETGETTPQGFSLQQNYPNPFNPETQIQYEIPKFGKAKVQVSLAIYNVTGQLVRRLVDEKKAPGVYRVTWDGKNGSGIGMSSGTYFYTIKAGDFKDSKKMLLVK
ncbi:MAG: T9SS type A sorting domain-containing protein, partial [Calditrichaeota bacterium]|nr:T9SS type A sorting domain-containing protein [Calditrichota bacterium]